MAANNYFGYTTGGTQFGATPAATYTTNPAATAAAGYAAVQHAAQQYAAAPRPTQAGYETYQPATHQTTYQYTSRPQSTTQVAYSTADSSHYQTGISKPTYTANSSPYSNTAQPRTTPQKAQGAGASQTPATSYVYSTNTVSGPAANYVSSYNAAATTAYPAAAVYAASQSAGANSAVQGGAIINKAQTGTWGGGGFKKAFVKTQKIKAPPKPQQLHYCEVCKISCAGPQTYREHLEGQKHKKKEVAAKAGNPAPFSRGGASLRCELCDVTCTGQDAYAAHIRGSKHQKVVKLHTKLGKPIPSTDPVVLSTGTAAGAKPGTKQNSGTKMTGSPGADGKKVLGGTKLKSIGGDGTTAGDDKKESDDDDKDESMDDKSDVQPVGQDYIEEIKSDEGKVISFQCKLCDCRFNDPNAKEMHMKGRRHRLQYKKKVNPDLVVDIKPSLRLRKIQEDRLRRQQVRDELWKRREEDRWRDEMRMMEEEERMYWEERRRYEEEMEYYEWYRRYGRDPHMLPPPPMPRVPFMGPPIRGPQMMPLRRPDSVDDRHIMSKHTSIYPKEEELNTVQKVVLNTERALKQVSDFLAESDAPKDAKKSDKKGPSEGATAAKDASKDTKKTDKKDPPEGESGASGDKENAGPTQPERMMKGVMRVGVLSKGLLLTGDGNVQLIVMCSDKPTRTLLDRVADNLPKQFAEICPDDKYEVKPCVEEAAIKVESNTEPKIIVTITLTSPVMRDSADKDGESGESVKDPPDVLDRQKCLAALAALRHAKWFQARASGLQTCVMIIRIMRDLCQRVPTWGRITIWTMELLVEKIIGSASRFLSPGDSLRRVFEAVASGLFLPGGSGLMDPCEREQVDAAGYLSNQDREDITASSQYALRLIAFRQIHKVLGMDPLPPPKFNRVPFPRKRRLENSTGEGNDSEGADGKKDKKEEKSGSDEPGPTSVATKG